MNTQGYIGYIRVSTVQQGTKGVSLVEQKDAITRYAERNRLTISTWFEEMETAAKRGRPVFAQAMKLLRQGKAKGIILHKLDRGARNLKDWADIGELADQGVEVHFVNESLDLHSRGGRLSADIQAVVAADYIRNLREESRKGFYGRLKQGMYPLPAPLGYLDQGRGKEKKIDPINGPLVRQAFELYATARYDLIGLSDEMYRRGLRSRSGGKVGRSTLSDMLNNPFYIGVMRIKIKKEMFPGIHNPLITKAVFDRVRAVLSGKVNTRTQHHSFTFRRMLRCAECQYSLIGEIQKGHVYYRCHSKQCYKTSIKEEDAETAVFSFLDGLHFNDAEVSYLKSGILKARDNWSVHRDVAIKSLNLRLSQIGERLNRITDAFLDQALDKEMYETRRQSLLFERKSIEENITNFNEERRPFPEVMEKILELATTASLSYKIGSQDERREMLRILTSNCIVRGRNVEIEPSIGFRDILQRSKNANGCPYRAEPRTLDAIMENLATLNTQGLLPDLEPIIGCLKKDNEAVEILKE